MRMVKNNYDVSFLSFTLLNLNKPNITIGKNIEYTPLLDNIETYYYFDNSDDWDSPVKKEYNRSENSRYWL